MGGGADSALKSSCSAVEIDQLSAVNECLAIRVDRKVHHEPVERKASWGLSWFLNDMVEKFERSERVLLATDAACMDESICI